MPDLQGATLRLEALDVAMLRVLYREGVDSLWGIDPRLNASRIAKLLGSGRSRVAARLRRWEKSGVLSKYAVWLNPALLDHRGAWVALKVESTEDKSEVIHRVGLMDGVVSATEFLGPMVNLGLVYRNRAQLERRLELIRGLSGIAEAGLLSEWSPRVLRGPLTPLEVRMVRALRAQPATTLEDAAGRAGVSVRTFARKYSALLDRSAIWFQPVFDFRRVSTPVVVLCAELSPGRDAKAIARELRAHYPLLIELADQSVSGPGRVDLTEWALVLPSAACIDEMTQWVSSLDGVRHVIWKMPIRTYDFPLWFDERLREMSRAGIRS